MVTLNGQAAPAAGSDGAAATVVLLRDGELGLEVLLAERPHDRGSFRGAWVFPGGAVDEADAAGGLLDGIDAARRAAVRETQEEVGLDVVADELVPFSHWVPPQINQKRLVTTFFATRVPDGEIRLAPDEVIDTVWARPAEALAQHAEGALTLWPPTWVTLHGLTAHDSVDAALAAFAAAPVHRFAGRFADEQRSMILWQEDGEFDAGGTAAAGTNATARHRLVMTSLPWRYLADY